MPRDSTSNNFDQLSHDYDKRLSNSEHPPDDWHYPSRNIDENSQIIYQGYLFKQVRPEIHKCQCDADFIAFLFLGQFQDQRLETAMVCPGFDETSITILRYARRLPLQRSY